MIHNDRRPGKIRGGSTISQQTAKNVFLWPDRSYVRKGLEAYFTVLIETLWGKHRIIEVYLNVIEWGPGIYGAEAAAQHYFHKSASHLTPLESARLTAILPSPLKWRAAKPGPYVKKRSRRIGGAVGTIRNEGLAACLS
jgi:monofunctional biosynthetic peptidoglycan transglycosylase